MLPNLLIIGAARCGTTSLHEYLHEHPEIFMARGKELNFFREERNWHRGLGWYEQQFPPGSERIYGESSVGYTSYPESPGVPERIATVIPQAKLVYVVRDPVDRVASEYEYMWYAGVETRPAHQALFATGPNRYLDRSRYAFQLERFLAHFPQERILVIDQNDLLHARGATLSALFAFLEVRDDFVSPAFSRIHNAGRRQGRQGPLWKLRALTARPTAAVLRRAPFRVRRRLAVPLVEPILDEQTAQRLRGLLAPDAERLRALTGRRFPTWGI
jgi:hypothetical protein